MSKVVIYSIIVGAVSNLLVYIPVLREGSFNVFISSPSELAIFSLPYFSILLIMLIVFRIFKDKNTEIRYIFSIMSGLICFFTIEITSIIFYLFI